MKLEKSKKEVWSTEHDIFVLNAAMKHILEGGKLKNAFDEAALKTGRTPGACAFRFNSFIRQKYSDEIQRAKLQKGTKPSKSKVVPIVENMSHHEHVAQLSWDSVLHFLKVHSQLNQVSEKEYNTIQQQLADVIEENERLKRELESLNEIRSKVESFGMNFSKMINLLEHVRSLGIL